MMMISFSVLCYEQCVDESGLQIEFYAICSWKRVIIVELS